MDNIAQRARRYLDERRGARVTLAELARALAASPFHVQRTFKRAHGLSPLDYQREQRLEDAKRLLARGERVTDALYGAGYGSVSRFYERTARRLGMSARAYRERGRGERLAWATFSSPLGTVLIAQSAKGICALRLGEDAGRLAAGLAEEFCGAQLVRDARALGPAVRAVSEYLAGDATLAGVPLDLRGTVFQRRVWEALRRIPHGETRTYAEIARRIGRPGAARAVGSACGANPAALLVPCHRAVRADGALGGYAWGSERKRRLLALERRDKERA